MAEKEVKDAWERYTGTDIDDLNSSNDDILAPSISEGQSAIGTIKQLIQDKYAKDAFKNMNGTIRAYVLAVLSGPQVNNEASTSGGRLTKTVDLNALASPADAVRKKSNKPPLVKVIAKVPPIDSGLGWPKLDWKTGKPIDEFNEKLLESHGEYHQEIDTETSKIDQITPGSTILVQLAFPGRTSSYNGQPAGKIVGVKEVGNFSDIVIKESARKIHEQKCRTTISRSKRQGELYVGNTDENPNENSGPPVRRLKGRIKTGLYGNGFEQTKAHFDACMDLAPISFKHNIPGPAPSSKNAFVWVGHLRNNGHGDILNRPRGPGRETIIYAPMTLDLTSPIEIKYYFHDSSGFGAAFTEGLNATIEQSVNSAVVGAGGIDFQAKLAPGIKDMIKDGRNFILVIPEMAHSHSPAGTAGSRNREFSTFDGTMSGGMFGLFHEEVIETLEAHLGSVIRDKLEFISIVADGMGAISLASIVRDNPFSQARTLARNSFRDIPIKRIDYINNGQDDGSSNYAETFEKGPGYTIYQDYLGYWESTDSTRYVEFNYIVGPNVSKSNTFFESIEVTGITKKYKDNYKKSSGKGQNKFTFYTNNNQSSNNIVSLHVCAGRNTEVPYALSMINDFLPSFPGFPTKSNEAPGAPQSGVPDHAFIASTRTPSLSNLVKYQENIEQLNASNTSFEQLLIYMNGTPDRLCQPDAPLEYKVFCEKWGFDTGIFGTFFPQYVTYLTNKEKYYFYSYLASQELEIQKIRNSRSKLQKYHDQNEEQIESNKPFVREAETLLAELKERFDARYTRLDVGTLNPFSAILDEFNSVPNIANNPQESSYFNDITRTLGEFQARKALRSSLTKAIQKAGPESVRRPANCDPPPKKLSDEVGPPSPQDAAAAMQAAAIAAGVPPIVFQQAQTKTNPEYLDYRLIAIDPIKEGDIWLTSAVIVEVKTGNDVVEAQATSASPELASEKLMDELAKALTAKGLGELMPHMIQRLNPPGGSK